MGPALAGDSQPHPLCPWLVVLPAGRRLLSQSLVEMALRVAPSSVAATPVGGSGGRTAEVNGIGVLHGAVLAHLKAGICTPFPNGETEDRGLGPAGRGPRRAWAVGGAAGGGAPGPRRRRGAGRRASPKSAAAAEGRARSRSRAGGERVASGWRRHGVRGAAHRVPDPAARARAPAAPCARRTRALPGREWGAGRGLSGPGVSLSPQCLSRSLSSLSLRLAGLSVCCCLSLPLSLRLSRSVFPCRCVCLSLQVCLGPCLSLGLCLSRSLSDPAASFRVSPFISLPSCLLSPCLWFSVTAPAAPTPDPTPSVCLVGWGLSTLDHVSSLSVPLWQSQAGLTLAGKPGRVSSPTSRPSADLRVF